MHQDWSLPNLWKIAQHLDSTRFGFRPIRRDVKSTKLMPIISSLTFMDTISTDTTRTRSPAPFFSCLTLSTNFGQPKTWPVCRFRYCFLDICIRTIQLKHEGWGACFWTTASQDIFVGFYPLTILSGQGHTSELIAQHSHFSDDRSS